MIPPKPPSGIVQDLGGLSLEPRPPVDASLWQRYSVDDGYLTRAARVLQAGSLSPDGSERKRRTNHSLRPVTLSSTTPTTTTRSGATVPPF